MRKMASVTPGGDRQGANLMINAINTEHMHPQIGNLMSPLNYGPVVQKNAGTTKGNNT